MKRMISLILTMVLLSSVVSQFVTIAEGNLLMEYGSIVIDISDQNLDAEFREFVKEVARSYYDGSYDLNKYYYDASKIKREYDKGGFLGAHKDNPFSTYEDYADYEKYNIPVIQSMLIDGLKQKADSLIELGIENYSFGMSINPISGNWERNGKAVISQEQYDKKVEQALKTAENSAYMNCLNAVGDLVLVLATNGKTPQLAADSLDGYTNWLAEILNALTYEYYEALQGELHNCYRDLITQDMLGLYGNVEGQLLDDYLQLQNELYLKEDRTNYENDLLDQLTQLLDAIQKMPKTVLTEQDEKLANSVASEFADLIGGEEYTFCPEEMLNRVILKAIKSFLVNLFDVLLKQVLPKTIAVSIAKAILKTVIDEVVDQWINEKKIDISIDVDRNGMTDFWDIWEACISVLIDHEALKECLEKALDDERIITYFITKEIADSAKIINQLKEDIEDLSNEIRKIANKPKVASNNGKQLNKNTTLTLNGNRNELQQKVKKKADEKARTLAKKSELEDQKAQLNKLTGIGVLLSNLVQCAIDLFSVSVAAAGLGDTADGEVFYGYIACYMYHTMQSAEERRQTLDDGFKKMIDPSYIDDAEIDELKNFVNRVYAVYELDMMGHASYISLDEGWVYQNGEKWDEAMAIRSNYHKQLHENTIYNSIPVYDINSWARKQAIEYYCTFIVDGALIFYGAQRSEYLKEVDKRKSSGGYGWIDLDLAYEVYTKIADYAKKAQIPQKFIKGSNNP